MGLTRLLEGALMNISANSAPFEKIFYGLKQWPDVE
jgi:hypothetical protein